MTSPSLVARPVLAHAPSHQASDPEVAVVAMHCRLPGASDTRAFWDAIVAGRSSFATLHDRHFGAELLELCRRQGLSADATATAGLIEAPYAFDAQFFRTSLVEAEAIDPQARLLLRTVAELLEEAFVTPFDLDGTRTGMFIGISGSDHVQEMARNLAPGDTLGIRHALGGADSASVGRVARHFNWKGPAEALDTACSSSLVAVARAVDALRLGRADIAIAGGVNLILSPLPSIAFMAAGMLSPDGRCRPFDAQANGYVRGEGCGLVMLKRLSDAERDGDEVLAVVRGSALNHNGSSNGLTAPNPKAQAELIVEAWGERADRIDYVEAHGTGTRLGDPIEVRALAQCLDTAATRRGAVAIGSVKANIGHLEAAAGIAGLIKAILIGRHACVPPQTGFTTLNPLLTRYADRLRVPTAAEALAGDTFHLGVSSFGFSGTNAHVLLEVARAGRADAASAPHPPRPMLIGVSGRNPAALAGRLDALQAALKAGSEAGGYAAIVREAQFFAHHEKRAAILANDATELLRGVQGAISAVAGNAAVQESPPRAIGIVSAAQGFEPSLRGKKDMLADHGLREMFLAAGGAEEEIGEARFFLFALAEQGLGVDIGGIAPAAFGRGRSLAIADAVLRRPPADRAGGDLMLHVGHDLRLGGPDFASYYGDDPHRNTLVTFGMLYSLGVIQRLPRWSVRRPAEKRLPHYPFALTTIQAPRARSITPPQLAAHAVSTGELTTKSTDTLRRYQEVWERAARFADSDAPPLLLNLDRAPDAAARTGWTTVAAETSARFAVLARADRLTDVRAACDEVVATHARVARERTGPFAFHVLIDGAGAAAGPLEGALAGLTGTLTLERPTADGVLVRLDDANDPACWRQAAAFLASPQAATELHARISAEGASLKRLKLAPTMAPTSADTTGLAGRAVVVTGASSSIAQQIVRRVLAERPGRLLLLGRRPAGAAMTALLADAAAAGVVASYACADLSDPAGLADALRPFLAALAEAVSDCAIIHAAGQLGEREPVASLDGSRADAAWAAKVDGLLHLMALLPRIGHINVLTSVSAIWGLAGHARYAMANGFLHGLASSQVCGAAITSQAWGVWRDSAMLRSIGDPTQLGHVGLGTHDPAAAADLIAASFSQPAGASILAAIEPSRVARGLPRPALFERLVTAPRRVTPRQPATDRDVIDSIVARLRDDEGFVLDLPADLGKGLFDLGLNSLTVMGLGAMLQEMYGVTLSGNDLFQAATIADLAALVAQRGRLGDAIESAPSSAHRS